MSDKPKRKGLSGSSNPMFRNAKIKSTCLTCGIEFLFYKGCSSGKFCSQPCSHKSQERRDKISASKTGIKMSDLSRARMSASGKGKKKPVGFGNLVSVGLKKFWDSKGRRGRLYDLAKSHPLFKVWQTKVRENAGFACEKCGKSKCKLDAHHIIPYIVLLLEFELGLASMENVHDIENGMCLCRECHKKQHQGGFRFHQLPEGRLFSAIKNLHEVTPNVESFDGFYKKQMEIIINRYKDKLPKEQE